MKGLEFPDKNSVHACRVFQPLGLINILNNNLSYRDTRLPSQRVKVSQSVSSDTRATWVCHITPGFVSKDASKPCGNEEMKFPCAIEPQL